MTQTSVLMLIETSTKSKIYFLLVGLLISLPSVGYMLLAGRLRQSQDQDVVQEIIQKHFKRNLDPRTLFGWDGGEGGVASKACLSLLKSSLPPQFCHLVWTEELLKVAVLVHRCLQFDEPVLLVGETG